MQYLYALTRNALGKFAEYCNTRRASFAHACTVYRPSPSKGVWFVSLRG